MNRGQAPRNWLTFGNLHIPLVGGALILGNSALARIQTPWPYVLLASAGAFLVYQLDRLVLIGPEDRINEPERVAWAAHHRKYTLLSIVAAVAVIALSWPFVQPEVKLWIPLLGVPGLAYGLRIPGTGRRLKQIGWIKSPVILFSWVVGTTTLVLMHGGMDGGGSIVLLTLYRLLYLAPSVMIADYVDRKGDGRAGIRTVSQWLGPKTLRMVAAGTAITASGVLAWLITSNGWPSWAWLDAIGLVLTVTLVFRARRPDGQTVLFLDLLLISPMIVWVMFVAGG